MKNLLLLIFLFCTIGFSQSEQDSIVIPKDENSQLRARPSLENLADKYSGDEFNYEVKTGESQNLLKRFLNWFGNWLDDTFGIKLSADVLNVLKWLIYILMSGIVIYLIIRLLVNERFDAIFTKKAKSVADIALAEQHIETVDFDTLLTQALQEKDYRLAVRYHFLKLLKILSQKEIIDWHFEKTNSDYQKEIDKPELKKGFGALAYLYDYVWYGEQPINESSFEQAKQRFELMNDKIGNGNG